MMAEKEKNDYELTQQNDAAKGAVGEQVNNWKNELVRGKVREGGDGRKRKAIISWHNRMTQQKAHVSDWKIN